MSQWRTYAQWVAPILQYSCLYTMSEHSLEESDYKHRSPITGKVSMERTRHRPCQLTSHSPLAHPLYLLDHILYLTTITKIVRSVPTRLYAVAYLFPKKPALGVLLSCRKSGVGDLQRSLSMLPVLVNLHFGLALVFALVFMIYEGQGSLHYPYLVVCMYSALILSLTPAAGVIVLLCILVFFALVFAVAFGRVSATRE